MNTKEDYRQKLQAQLDEWNANIHELEARAQQVEADAKIEFTKRLQELREQRDAAQARMTELENANEDAWESLKGGIKDAWDELGRAVQDALARYK